MRNKLVIFDGNALMHRAFHALPSLFSKNGMPINAVYGLISILINVVEDLKPSHIIFCFDEKEKTFRQKIYPSYQKQRPKTPFDLALQFKIAYDFLAAANILVYSKAGFEADDVIGTICLQVVNPKLQINETIVVTGDRDILQLVDDKKNIKLLMPITGFSGRKMFNEKETIERMSVLPSQIPDYKALVGDPSDNYFGVKGIGPKTAVNLLKKYGSFREIYKCLKEMPDKLKGKLKKNRKSAELSYKLAVIVKDVPMDIDIENSNKWDLISTNVLNLFSELGLKTLSGRIRKLGETLKSEKQGSLF